MLDVYKVENAPELDRFQKRAAAMEPGKVKGLFTSVKGTSIERIIALGMGPSGDGSGAGSIATEGARLERERKALFRRAWYAYHNNKSEVGYAENRIGKSQGCHFPRSFSRYSTLESDRDHVEAAARGFLESTRSSSASGGGGSEGGHGSVAGAPGSGTIPPSLKDGGGPITDDIRYLVLCRVAVGKVFVTSKEYKGFPSVGNDPAFDSMYNPLQEEYLVLRPDQVLPEFIIQYVFKKLPSSAVSAKMAGKMAAASSSSMNTGSSSSASASLPLMPIDLSTPHVNLGPGDNPWQVPVASHSKKSSASTEVSVLVDPLPTRDAGRKSRMPTAFKDLNQSEDDKKSGSISISDSTGSSWMENDAARSAHAVEVMRREQQTSWEQLRLNGARQRETILERCGALVKTYRKHSAKLRGWERLRLREPVQDQPPLQTVEMVRSEVDTAESELSRQTMRRREMESEMNALKKRASRREESENRYGRRR